MLVFGFPNQDQSTKDVTAMFQEALDENRSFAIVRHDPSERPDIPTEVDNIHFHGLVKNRCLAFQNDRLWQRVRDKIKFAGGWIKNAVKVFSLNAVVNYLQMPSKHTIIMNLDSKTKAVWEGVTDSSIQDQVEKKKSKHATKNDAASDINQLREWMDKYGLFTESEMLAKFHESEVFVRMHTKRNYSYNFQRAFQLQSRKIIAMDVIGLIQMHKGKECDSELLSPSESLEVVKKWLGVQFKKNGSVNLTTFVNDIVDLLDRKRPKKNCLYMFGPPNCGKSFITRSIQRLCVLYHIPSGSNR